VVRQVRTERGDKVGGEQAWNTGKDREACAKVERREKGERREEERKEEEGIG